MLAFDNLFLATFQKYTSTRQPRLKSNGEGLTLFLRKMYFKIDVIILKYSEGYAWPLEHLFSMYVNHLEKLPNYSCYEPILYNSDFLLLREMANFEGNYKKRYNGCPLEFFSSVFQFFRFYSCPFTSLLEAFIIIGHC